MSTNGSTNGTHATLPMSRLTACTASGPGLPGPPALPEALFSLTLKGQH